MVLKINKFHVNTFCFVIKTIVINFEVLLSTLQKSSNDALFFVFLFVLLKPYIITIYD